ncbi:hypothetical protein [Streptomyces sp. NPDC002232]|uniref:hypothetical protein n=1 Tax=Streptomyces sp. NPDC002232 TaxID=3364640 RepID=UPI00368C9055
MSAQSAPASSKDRPSPSSAPVAQPCQSTAWAWNRANGAEAADVAPAEAATVLGVVTANTTTQAAKAVMSRKVDMTSR